LSHPFFSFNFNIINSEKFLSKRWYFDQIYNVFIARNVYFFGKRVGFSLVDRGFIEIFGSEGFLRIIRLSWFRLSKYLQTGYVFHYLHLMMSGLVFIVMGLIYFEHFLIIFNIIFVLIIVIYLFV